MKKTGLIILLFIILSLYSFYPPFTKLIKIETEHFVIYYEKSIEEIIDKNYIKFMEDSYNFLGNLFNHSFNKKIYVYFSNREKVTNGFDSPIGQSTIYIITTPPQLNSSIGNMDEWLKLVFYHELTHQFSLTLKNNFAEFLSSIFGNIFLSSYFNNPFFMIEGVTTSFEGRNRELGRTYSPFIKQYLMQSIIDSNFKSPYELSSSYDKWPYGSIGYWYGGFFSKFLQDTYGMDLYIKLWQKTSVVNFFNALQEIYGKDLSTLWDEFYDWLKPDFEIAINPDDCLKNNRKDFLTNGRLIKIDDKTYYLYYNIDLKTIFSYDVELKKIEPIIKNIKNFSSFEVDSSNNRILLSYYDYKNSNSIIKNKIFDLTKKRFEKSNIESFNDIREISFFNDEFIGIDLSRSFTDLVYINQKNKKELLLKGNKYFYISMPKQVNSENIAFLGSINGERGLFIYNILNKNLKKLDLNAKYIYSFNVFENKIYFTYNDDYTFSKFAILKNDTEIYFDKNFSGGFSDPYYIDNKIFYLGFFSDKSLLLKFDINLTDPQEAKKLYITDQNIQSVKVFYFDKEKNLNIEVDKDKNPVLDSGIFNIDDKNSTKEVSNEKIDEIKIEKSTSTFPFNENLLPDFWLPSITGFIYQSLYNFDIYYSGIGAGFFWFEPVSGSFSYLGLYIYKLDPFLLSFDYTCSLSYFDPFYINFSISSYWYEDVNLDENILNHSFNSSLNISYIYSKPFNKFNHYINLGFYYDKSSEQDFFSIFLMKNLFFNIYFIDEFKVYFKQLFYYSNHDFSSLNSYKYEIEGIIKGSIKIINFNIELKDNLALSDKSKLNLYPINDYFHLSLYEPLFEIIFEQQEQFFNFINVLKIEGTILESNDKGVLNILFPLLDLGLYIGYKYYLASNINYSNFTYTNLLEDQIAYLSLILFTPKDLLIDSINLNFGLVASYSISKDKIYLYFYMTFNNYYTIFKK